MQLLVVALLLGGTRRPQRETTGVHDRVEAGREVKREGGTGSTWGMLWGTRSRGIHLGGEETVIAAARVPPLHCAVRVLTAD